MASPNSAQSRTHSRSSREEEVDGDSCYVSHNREDPEDRLLSSMGRSEYSSHRGGKDLRRSSAEDDMMGEKIMGDEKRYCWDRLSKKQFWWTISVASLLLLLTAVILLVIFVGGRSIAQGSVDESVISLESLYIPTLPSDPTDMMLTVKINGSIAAASGFHAEISPARTFLSYEGQHFGYMDAPEIRLRSALSVLKFDSELHVEDLKAYQSFASALARNEELNLRTVAEIDVRVAGITFKGLDMDKMIRLKGLNNLGTIPPVIKQQQVIASSSDSLSIAIDAEIHNPSSLAVGNTGPLAFDILYDGVKVGESISPNETRQIHGTNPLSLTATLQRTSENAAEFESLLSQYGSGKEVFMTISGSENPRGHPLMAASTRALRTKISFLPIDTIGKMSPSPTAMVFDSLNSSIPAEAVLYYVQARSFPEPAYMVRSIVGTVPGILEIGNQRDEEECGSPDVDGTYMDSYVNIFNQMDLNLTILSWHLDASFAGAANHEPFVLGVASKPFTGSPVIELPPRATSAVVQRVCIKSLAETVGWFLNYVAFKYPEVGGAVAGSSAAVGFNVDLVLNGSVNATLGDFPMTLPFTQNVTAYLTQLS